MSISNVNRRMYGIKALHFLTDIDDGEVPGVTERENTFRARGKKLMINSIPVKRLGNPVDIGQGFPESNYARTKFEAEQRGYTRQVPGGCGGLSCAWETSWKTATAARIP